MQKPMCFFHNLDPGGEVFVDATEVSDISVALLVGNEHKGTVLGLKNGQTFTVREDIDEVYRIVENHR